MKKIYKIFLPLLLLITIAIPSFASDDSIEKPYVDNSGYLIIPITTGSGFYNDKGYRDAFTIDDSFLVTVPWQAEYSMMGEIVTSPYSVDDPNSNGDPLTGTYKFNYVYGSSMYDNNLSDSDTSRRVMVGNGRRDYGVATSSITPVDFVTIADGYATLYPNTSYTFYPFQLDNKANKINVKLNSGSTFNENFEYSIKIYLKSLKKYTGPALPGTYADVDFTKSFNQTDSSTGVTYSSPKSIIGNGLNYVLETNKEEGHIYNTKVYISNEDGSLGALMYDQNAPLPTKDYKLLANTKYSFRQYLTNYMPLKKWDATDKRVYILVFTDITGNRVIKKIYFKSNVDLPRVPIPQDDMFGGENNDTEDVINPKTRFLYFLCGKAGVPIVLTGYDNVDIGNYKAGVGFTLQIELGTFKNNVYNFHMVDGNGNEVLNKDFTYKDGEFTGTLGSVVFEYKFENILDKAEYTIVVKNKTDNIVLNTYKIKQDNSLESAFPPAGGIGGGGGDNDGGFFQPIFDFFDNMFGSLFRGIVSIFSSITGLLDSVLSFSSGFTAFLKTAFSFIPPQLLSIIILGFSLTFVAIIIKILRG